jgi:hypothetical protein
MGVRDITPDAVLAAVLAGHDDVFKLAEHFGVPHVSHTLRSTIHELAEADPPQLAYVTLWTPLMRGAQLAVA